MCSCSKLTNKGVQNEIFSSSLFLCTLCPWIEAWGALETFTSKRLVQVIYHVSLKEFRIWHHDISLRPRYDMYKDGRINKTITSKARLPKPHEGPLRNFDGIAFVLRLKWLIHMNVKISVVLKMMAMILEVRELLVDLRLRSINGPGLWPWSLTTLGSVEVLSLLMTLSSLLVTVLRSKVTS